MPCIEEWLSNPLLVIDSMKDNDSDSQIKQVKEYFSQRLSQEGIQRVQSINEKSLDHLKPNTLVRFRCMIQDIFEPEYFLSIYETIDKANQEKDEKFGLYRDVASCKHGHEVNLNSSKNVTKERQCFYCVPIPGETTWAKKAFAKTCELDSNNSKDVKTKIANPLKRDFDSVDEKSPGTSCSMAIGNCTEEDEKVTKRTKPDISSKATEKAIGFEGTDLNFPLPEEQGPACIVKVYGEFESFKVNDIVEFVGVLSVDPLLTGFHEERGSDEPYSVLEAMDLDQESPQSLPSSLVPRIHAVIGYKLQHSNPLLSMFTESTALGSLFSEMAQIREQLLDVFKEMLYGDSVAGEYLLLHLLSTVYSRPDVLALGKYTLNLTGISKEVAKDISEMVEFIVAKCHKFPMTILNLNNSKLVPKKDYNTNRLISGKLQLSQDSHLILDETVLEEGQLDNTGVVNISALNYIISWQKLQYDFSYYKKDFATNVVILVLSEGKSLLQADSRLVVEIQKPPVPFQNIIQNCEEGFFDNVRKYISLARLIPYEISSNIKKYIEDDFVQMRQAAPGEMNVERFHSLLSLARLMAISYGRKHLLLDDWKTTKELERVRQCRLDQRSH